MILLVYCINMKMHSSEPISEVSSGDTMGIQPSKTRGSTRWCNPEIIFGGWLVVGSSHNIHNWFHMRFDEIAKQSRLYVMYIYIHICIYIWYTYVYMIYICIYAARISNHPQHVIRFFPPWESTSTAVFAAFAQPPFLGDRSWFWRRCDARTRVVRNWSRDLSTFPVWRGWL